MLPEGPKAGTQGREAGTQVGPHARPGSWTEIGLEGEQAEDRKRGIQGLGHGRRDVGFCSRSGTNNRHPVMPASLPGLGVTRH